MADPKYDAEAENEFVGEIRLATSPEYEGPSLLTVVRPCDHRGKGEQEHSQRKYKRKPTDD